MVGNRSLGGLMDLDNHCDLVCGSISQVDRGLRARWHASPKAPYEVSGKGQTPQPTRREVAFRLGVLARPQHPVAGQRPNPFKLCDFPLVTPITLLY